MNSITLKINLSAVLLQMSNEGIMCDEKFIAATYPVGALPTINKMTGESYALVSGEGCVYAFRIVDDRIYKHNFELLVPAGEPIGKFLFEVSFGGLSLMIRKADETKVLKVIDIADPEAATFMDAKTVVDKMSVDEFKKFIELKSVAN